MKHAWLVALGTLILTSAGCGEDPAAPGLADGPDPGHEAAMFRTVLSYLTQAKNLPVKGDWPEDFGDANFYGPGFFFRYGKTAGRTNAPQLELGQQTQSYNLSLLDETTGNLPKLITKLEDVMMALFGLVEGHRHSPDAAALAKVTKAMDGLELLGKTVNYWPDTGSSIGGYGVDTYGPTTTNASLALINLELADALGKTEGATYLQRAEAILATGYSQAFDTKTGYYKFSSARPGLYLYPNITQLVAHLQAHQLTGKKLYLDRAVSLHKAIAPLKVAGEGRYRSPYSAKTMGAKTTDYTTLSSQNFTMIGLSLMYSITKQAQYSQEVKEILGFVRTKLLQTDGRVLHHWMDGHIAQPKDPEYYCSGCNLQLLYIIWRLEDLLR